MFVSAFLFPGSTPAKALEKVLDAHTLILCHNILNEIRHIFKKKFPGQLLNLEVFLAKISYEMAPKPSMAVLRECACLRDETDIPILAAALASEVDVFLTGDKDFMASGLSRPLILTPKLFLETGVS